jgi:hypothetical protein
VRKTKKRKIYRRLGGEERKRNVKREIRRQQIQLGLFYLYIVHMPQLFIKISQNKNRFPPHDKRNVYKILIDETAWKA